MCDAAWLLGGMQLILSSHQMLMLHGLLHRCTIWWRLELLPFWLRGCVLRVMLCSTSTSSNAQPPCEMPGLWHEVAAGASPDHPPEL